MPPASVHADGLSDDLVHELIDDINQELGQLVSDFFYVALPRDAVIGILSELDARTLAGCACVSHQWRNFSEEDDIWDSVAGRMEERAGRRGEDELSAIGGRYPRPVA
jgi:hypothetical protein